MKKKIFVLLFAVILSVLGLCGCSSNDDSPQITFYPKAEETAITAALEADTSEIAAPTKTGAPTISTSEPKTNTASIITKVICGNTSFLFTGDAESNEEHDIISQGFDLSATVLKAGHHGSETSSSYSFLREVMPKYVVISVGKDNQYGHPDENALSRFRDVGAKTYRTDLQGDIIFKSNGNEVTVTTQRNANAETNSTIAQGSETSQAAQAANTEAQYIGNKNSKKFHRPSCRSLPAEKNRVYFNSRDEAINAYYDGCKNCNP